MVYYCTKKMMEHFTLKCPEEFTSNMKSIVMETKEQEKDLKIYHWGCKHFQFNEWDCILVSHALSKFSFFFFSIDKKKVESLPNLIAQYLIDEIYANDKSMQKALRKYFKSSYIAYFDKLSDRKLVATLNHILLDWDNGYRFVDYIENGMLSARKINLDLNFEDIHYTEYEGEKYYNAASLFEKLIMDQFG